MQRIPQNHRSLGTSMLCSAWQPIACLLLLLLPSLGHCFGPDTTVSIILDYTTIDRTACETSYGSDIMPGTVKVSQAGQDNSRIKLDGRRQGTLLPNETYWSMPTSFIYLSSGQVEVDGHIFPFGAAPSPPPNNPYSQTYRYTATIWAAKWVTGSADLTITAGNP